MTLSVGNMLHVEVCEANGLPAADPWGSSDPYCKVTYVLSTTIPIPAFPHGSWCLNKGNSK